MNIAVEQFGEVTVLRLPGNVMRDRIPALAQSIKSCVEQRRHVVLDLGQAEYLSSLALGVIEDQLAALRARGRDMKLSSASDHVKALLEEVGLASKIQLCDDTRAALTTFGNGVGQVERSMLCQ